MLRRRYTIEECTVCPWRNFCQGGCEAFTSLRTGSLWVNDEFCDFRRELYRETALRQARMKSGA
jgi:sulfatase maturation enzyme AslB (radical SAM superfamily)